MAVQRAPGRTPARTPREPPPGIRPGVDRAARVSIIGPVRGCWVMRLTLRLLAGIWLSAVLIVGAFAFVSIRAERARFADDLSRRAWLLGEGLREAVAPIVGSAPPARVERLIRRFGAPGRGIAVYDRFANLIVATPEWAPRIPQPLPFVSQVVAKASVQDRKSTRLNSSHLGISYAV